MVWLVLKDGLINGGTGGVRRLLSWLPPSGGMTTPLPSLRLMTKLEGFKEENLGELPPSPQSVCVFPGEDCQYHNILGLFPLLYSLPQLSFKQYYR